MHFAVQRQKRNMIDIMKCFRRMSGAGLKNYMSGLLFARQIATMHFMITRQQI